MIRGLTILFLPVLSVRDVLQLAGVAPAANDAVGGAGIDAKGGEPLVEIGCLGRCEGEADIHGLLSVSRLFTRNQGKCTKS